MAMTFNQMYERFTSEFEDNFECIYFNRERIITCGELKERVEQLTRHLIQLGIRRGDGVGYSLRNHPDIIALFVAISRIGAYAVPIFAGLPARAKMAMLKKTRVSIVIVNVDSADELQKEFDNEQVNAEIVVLEEGSAKYKTIYGDCTSVLSVDEFLLDAEECKDDLLMFGSSSGTTGIPKLVPMNQVNVGSEITVTREMFWDKWEREPNKNKIATVAFPLSTSVMLVLCGGLLSGLALAFSDNFSTMFFLEMTEKWKSDLVIAPPAYFESLMLLEGKQSFDLSSVTRMAAGMDFCSPALLKRLKTLFPSLKYFQSGYGLVETCNVYMYATTDISGEEISGTACLSLAETADNVIQILDENGQVVADGEVGEIHVKGSNLVKGYVDDNLEMLESFEEKWFRTGDIARKENDRTATLLGRKKYFIKRGGKSVSPIVVQTEINKTKGVCESGVVGVPHPLYGEMLWAFVVREKDAEVALKDIKIQCKKELPYYMLPDQVTFINEIPKKGGVGKVDYETLRKMGNEELKKISKSL